MRPHGKELPVIIVPGLGGSTPDHWQSYFERSIAGATRMGGVDWNKPDLCEWADSLRRCIGERPDCLLVAHSLGCTLIAHLAKQNPDLPVRGAFLVAPADVDKSAALAVNACSFSEMPRQILPFPAITVASRNDPYISFERAKTFAAGWASRLIDAGQAGHINVASGFGPWPEGQEILNTFARDLTAPLQKPVSSAKLSTRI